MTRGRTILAALGGGAGLVLLIALALWPFPPTAPVVVIGIPYHHQDLSADASEVTPADLPPWPSRGEIKPPPPPAPPPSRCAQIPGYPDRPCPEDHEPDPRDVLPRHPGGHLDTGGDPPISVRQILRDLLF